MPKSVSFRTLPAIVVCFLLSVGVQASPMLGEHESKIASETASLLEEEHFSGKPLDDLLSGIFLETYLDSLDPARLFFLKSDVDEWTTKYGTKLDDSILVGDLTPAREIFDRFLLRAGQRVEAAKTLLAGKISFEAHESAILDRSKSPWPADDKEAQELWRRRVKMELLQERLHQKDVTKAADIILKRYERFLENLKDMETDELLETYLCSLSHAYDPHSDYMAPSAIEEFDIHMQLSMRGIGAVLMSEDGYAKIVELVPGGAAALNGQLKVNDRIVSVGQGTEPMVDVVNMRLTKVVKLIRGPKNSQVRLLVWPALAADPAARKEIVIKRDEIHLTERAAKARTVVIRDAAGKQRHFGVVTLPSFYVDLKGGKDGHGASRDVMRLLEQLNTQKVEGIVLDMRSDAGGSLEEAVNLTGLFISEGPVVQIRDRRNRVGTLDDENPTTSYDGPLVVLVDHLSASASEIVAAALQDYGRAIIIGDNSTFGKGTVQKLEDLDRRVRAKNSGALKLTVQKFYRVSGGSTQYKGVVPDIMLPSVLDAAKINESSLKNALPYDEIPPAKFSPVDRVSRFLDALRAASVRRTAADPEFKYISEDLARFKKESEEKTISLNEEERRAKMKAAEQQEAMRKKERAARPKSPFQFTDLTPDPAAEKSAKAAAAEDQADLPGSTEDSREAALEEAIRILMDLSDAEKKPAPPVPTTL